jgi:hypothetical protein
MGEGVREERRGEGRPHKNPFFLVRSAHYFILPCGVGLHVTYVLSVPYFVSGVTECFHPSLTSLSLFYFPDLTLLSC